MKFGWGVRHVAACSARWLRDTNSLRIRLRSDAVRPLTFAQLISEREGVRVSNRSGIKSLELWYQLATFLFWGRLLVLDLSNGEPRSNCGLSPTRWKLLSKWKKGSDLGVGGGDRGANWSLTVASGVRSVVDLAVAGEVERRRNCEENRGLPPKSGNSRMGLCITGGGPSAHGRHLQYG